MDKAPSPVSFILYGDSHALTVKTWWDSIRVRYRSPAVSLTVQQHSSLDDAHFTIPGDNGTVILNPPIAADLSVLGVLPFKKFFATPAVVRPWLVLHVAGSAYSGDTRNRWGDVDFAVEDGFGTMTRFTGAQLLPADVVRQHVRTELAPVVKGLEIIASYGTERVAVVPPPPPHRSNEFVDAHHQGFPPTSAPHVRLKLQWIYHQMLRETCSRLGILFHDIWPIVAEEDGFLNARFEHDGCHATADCGGLVFLSLYEKVTHGRDLFDKPVDDAMDAAAIADLAQSMLQLKETNSERLPV